MEESMAWRHILRATLLGIEELKGYDEEEVLVCSQMVLDLTERGRRPPKSWFLDTSGLSEGTMPVLRSFYIRDVVEDVDDLTSNLRFDMVQIKVNEWLWKGEWRGSLP